MLPAPEAILMPGYLGADARNANLWIDQVIEDRETIEDKIDMPMGEMLGCGRWGCVFASDEPWVIKITRDPTEGPLWATLQEWQRNTSTQNNAGLVRIREVLQLRPGVDFEGEEWPLYVAVREGVVPIYPSYGSPVLTKGAARMLDLEPYTKLSSDPSLLTDESQLYWTLQSLKLFREHADDYYRSLFEPRDEDPPYYAGEFELQLMDSTLKLMSEQGGWIGGPLSLTMQTLVESGIILRDVHGRNVGLRVHRNIYGEELPPGLVIFDPGHTPTPERPVRQEMRRNDAYC